uniref:Uncharacterized protein n=1 Tax=Oryza punctata TaxID=4537 RepID=A0A0E0JZZ5_ORYPU
MKCGRSQNEMKYHHAWCKLSTSGMPLISSICHSLPKQCKNYINCLLSWKTSIGLIKKTFQHFDFIFHNIPISFQLSKNNFKKDFALLVHRAKLPRQEMLLEAASDGDLGLLKRVVRSLDGGRGRLAEAVEAVRECGAGALHLAAGAGKLAVCRYLVEELRVDANAIYDEGETPLACAVNGANVATVRYFVDHGAHPDKVDNKGFTPLHFAAEEGLHCNKIVSGFYTPLLVAIYASSLKCVKLLIKAGADVNGIGNIIPLVAAACSSLGHSCLMIWMPIEFAIRCGTLKDVNILFPLTFPMPTVPDWTVGGIICHVNTLPGQKVYESGLEKEVAGLKLQGVEALEKQDYLAASDLYTKALCLDFDDATLYSNRSLCFLHMGDGDKAYADAYTCRMMRPDWPKACYRQGAALMLMKEFQKACDALLDGFKMDPGNAEIESTLSMDHMRAGMQRSGMPPEMLEVGMELMRLLVGDSIPDPPAHRGEIARWLEALAAKGVQELVFVNRPWPLDLRLPAALFGCSSLTRLHVGVWRLPDTRAVPRGAAFPHLREMVLSCVVMEDRDLAFLLDRSPALEALAIITCQDGARVRLASRSLRILQVCLTVVNYIDVVDAPRLERLMLWMTSKHQRCHSSMVKIRNAPKLRSLGFMEPGMHELEIGNTIIKAGMKLSPSTVVRSVKILALEVKFTVRSEARMLPSFLKCFPNVETLHIHSAVEDEPTGNGNGKLNLKFWQDAGPIECVQHHIKKVIMQEFRGTKSELAFLKFVVERAQKLSMLIVVTNGCFCSGYQGDAQARMETLMASAKWASEGCKLVAFENPLSQVGTPAWSFRLAFDLDWSDPFDYGYYQASTVDPRAPTRRLLQAAADGDLAAFKRIAGKLDGGKGRLREAVEGVRDRGAGALHVASGRGMLAVCSYLVEELQVDVDATDDTGDTPLAYAVRGSTINGVRYLLDHGANPDKPDNKGSTPLHVAAMKGECEIAKILLSSGAHVDPFSSHGTPLHLSAFCQQDGVMKILLDHHADCNKLLKPVFTPLIMALNSGSLKCVELLLKAGADVKGVGMVTPLITAANNGLTDFYKCLLEAGADPNVPDEFGHLPIELAAYNNRRKDVEILLSVTSRIPSVHDWSVDGVIRYVKSCPSVEDDPMYKMRPADMKLEASKAYKRQDYITAMKLYTMLTDICPNDATLILNRSLCWLKMGAGVNALQDAQICRLMHSDWSKACYLEGAAQMLLKDFEKACDAFFDGLKMDPTNDEIAEALRKSFESLKISHSAKIQFQKKKNFLVAERPGVPQQLLIQAAAAGDLPVFKRMARMLDGGKGRLKEAVEAVKDRGAGALHQAARNGRTAMCAYMVEELQVDINAADESDCGLVLRLLVMQFFGGTMDTVSYLLDHGANPDKPNEKGCTPLHLAVEQGYCEIVKVLLVKGANVDSSSDHGTPLHVAATKNQDGCMKILLDHRADCNKTFSTVCTPLIAAMMGRSLKCAKLLIEAGADVKGVGTFTPLIVAATEGLTDFCKCLLEGGADPDVPDKFGFLPIEIAARQNRRKDVEILLPVTSRIPSVHDWSVDGMITYVNKQVEVDPFFKIRPADLKLEGNRAYMRKDYHTAAKLYNMAADHDPEDITFALKYERLLA